MRERERLIWDLLLFKRLGIRYNYKLIKLQKVMGSTRFYVKET